MYVCMYVSTYIYFNVKKEAIANSSLLTYDHMTSICFLYFVFSFAVYRTYDTDSHMNDAAAVATSRLPTNHF